MATLHRGILQVLSLRAQSEAAALARARCLDCRVASPTPMSDMLGCPVRCGVTISLAAASWARVGPVDAAGLASALNCARLGLVFHRSAARETVLVGDALLARALRNAVRHGGCNGTAIVAQAVSCGSVVSVKGSSGDVWEEQWCALFRLVGADIDNTLRGAARGHAPSRAYLASIGVVEDCLV